MERDKNRISIVDKVTSLAGKVTLDAVFSLSKPMSEPIDGYPQRVRVHVRAWRTRIGHAIHYGGAAEGLFWVDTPFLDELLIAQGAIAIPLLIYYDFIRPSKNIRDLIRRFRKIYPLFPKVDVKANNSNE